MLMLDAKLDKLPISTLEAIRDQIADAIRRRATIELRVGGKAHFYSQKSKEKIIITVTKINKTTVDGACEKSGVKWRCSKPSLTPMSDEMTKTLPVVPREKLCDVPVGGEGAW